MKHLRLATRPRPQHAQVVGPFIRSVIAGLLFGLNPLFVFLLGQKVSEGLFGFGNDSE